MPSVNDQYVRLVQGKRLAYYRGRADESYWTDYWAAMDLTSHLRRLDGGMSTVFERYLPKNGKILEAGCGPGKWVLWAERQGYSIIGLDWSSETLQRTAAVVGPSTKFISGDVMQLPFESESFDACISLGVVEHFYDGPQPILNEAHRILKPGARLLLSTPYFSPLRQMKGSFDWLNNTPTLAPPADMEFYQYAYTSRELGALIRDSGFVIDDVVPLGGMSGLLREVALAQDLMGRVSSAQEAQSKTAQQAGTPRRKRKPNPLRSLKKALYGVLDGAPFSGWWGHAVMIVASKTSK